MNKLINKINTRSDCIFVKPSTLPNLGVFIFYPAYPAGWILTGVRNISQVLAPGYETFCKLDYGGTKHFLTPCKIGVRNISRISPSFGHVSSFLLTSLWFGRYDMRVDTQTMSTRKRKRRRRRGRRRKEEGRHVGSEQSKSPRLIFVGQYHTVRICWICCSHVEEGGSAWLILAD